MPLRMHLKQNFISIFKIAAQLLRPVDCFCRKIKPRRARRTPSPGHCSQEAAKAAGYGIGTLGGITGRAGEGARAVERLTS
jgi:hypothetical protein